MSERKVLNKYYPPDFDPSKIPRLRRTKEQLSYKVRLMAPFNMRCNACGNYIYKATKFNSKKEDAEGEDYLGIQIYRFYISCPRCSQQITFKTDPKNADYVIEHGATRNFELWKQENEKEEKIKSKKEQEEMGNAMKVLENRTKESKRDMEILDALEDIKEINYRNEQISIDAILNFHKEASHKTVREERMTEEEEDEALVQKVFGKETLKIKRIKDEEEDNDNIYFYKTSNKNNNNNLKVKKKLDRVVYSLVKLKKQPTSALAGLGLDKYSSGSESEG
ncbi:splicing factor YJU2-like [Zophobas morio]|uniref:splicing factor YJU2-like n=1 Tax=Zophobas morio TaxID=2755281 RepID=UPI003082C32C